eukprot:scaffold12381_cov63-Phaeocystis_antarctica.AAC.2
MLAGAGDPLLDPARGRGARGLGNMAWARARARSSSLEALLVGFRRVSDPFAAAAGGTAGAKRRRRCNRHKSRPHVVKVSLQRLVLLIPKSLHRLVLIIPAWRGRARQGERAVQLPRFRHLGHEELAQLPRQPERNGIVALGRRVVKKSETVQARRRLQAPSV